MECKNKSKALKYLMKTVGRVAMKPYYERAITIAKQEVFNDLENQLFFRDMSILNKKIISKLKKRHLLKSSVKYLY